MIKKIQKEIFSAEKFCRSVTKGPGKKRGQRVVSIQKQLKFPWYDNEPYKDRR